MTKIPSAVSDLDHAVVIAALTRNACNVSDAACDLGVPVSDLRRLIWATPRLQDRAFEAVEARLDLAEKAVFEALNSDDPRRKDAAAFFCLRNTATARKRGWLTSSTASLDVSINAPKQSTIFTWRPLSSALNSEDAKQQEAHRLSEVARAEAAGIEVVSFSWRDPSEPDEDVVERDGSVPRRESSQIEQQPAFGLARELALGPESEPSPEPALEGVACGRRSD